MLGKSALLSLLATVSTFAIGGVGYVIYSNTSGGVSKSNDHVSTDEDINLDSDLSDYISEREDIDVIKEEFNLNELKHYVKELNKLKDLFKDGNVFNSESGKRFKSLKQYVENLKKLKEDIKSHHKLNNLEHIDDIAKKIVLYALYSYGEVADWSILNTVFEKLNVYFVAFFIPFFKDSEKCEFENLREVKHLPFYVKESDLDKPIYKELAKKLPHYKREGGFCDKEKNNKWLINELAEKNKDEYFRLLQKCIFQQINTEVIGKPFHKSY